MSVESALFFESVEQIYARVFRSMRPRMPIPRISVTFRKYASVNSRIHLVDGDMQIFISDLLESAPAPIQEALAIILISKLFRYSPEKNAVARYQRYLNRAEMRRVLHLVKQQRGRKEMLHPHGKYYNLEAIFEDLNLRYFHGLMAQPLLGWSVRHSLSTLGHYDPSHNAIVLSRILDSSAAKLLIVEYVMFHEMLHLRYPTVHRGIRRCVHTPEFKAAERTFHEVEIAKCELKEFVAALR